MLEIKMMVYATYTGRRNCWCRDVEWDCFISWMTNFKEGWKYDLSLFLVQLWGANNDSYVLRFSFWKHPHLGFFVQVPKPWASSLPASVDSMVPKIILACGCCCLLLFPALCPLHCSGSSGWWAIPIPHPAEGSCDGNLGTEPNRGTVQPSRGTVSTGSGWGREGAAAHERQDGAATVDLQFRLCSLIYELEMEGRKCWV